MERGAPRKDSLKRLGSGQLLGLHLEYRSEILLTKEEQSNRLKELLPIFC